MLWFDVEIRLLEFKEFDNISAKLPQLADVLHTSYRVMFLFHKLLATLSFACSCDPVSRSGEGSWTDGGTQEYLGPQWLEETTESCPETPEDTVHSIVKARARTGQSTNLHD